MSEMSELSRRIAEHRGRLEQSAAQVDSLLAAVESLTDEARDTLREYQTLKRQADSALSDASEQFQQAQRAFGKADDLIAELGHVRDEHIELTHAVNRVHGMAGETHETRRMIEALQGARELLRETHKLLDRCRADARFGEADNDIERADEDEIQGTNDDDEGT
jgi:hypothetical protein